MNSPAYKYPALAKVGEGLGFAAGVTVTLALGLAPRSSKARGSSTGKPVVVTPIGSHPIERRHDAVYGPEITSFAQKLSFLPLHDVVLGFGEGATVAPGAAYKLEARLGALIAR